MTTAESVTTMEDFVRFCSTFGPLEEEVRNDVQTSCNQERMAQSTTEDLKDLTDDENVTNFKSVRLSRHATISALGGPCEEAVQEYRRLLTSDTADANEIARQLIDWDKVDAGQASGVEHRDIICNAIKEWYDE